MDTADGQNSLNYRIEYAVIFLGLCACLDVGCPSTVMA